MTEAGQTRCELSPEFNKGETPQLEKLTEELTLGIVFADQRMTLNYGTQLTILSRSVTCRKQCGSSVCSILTFLGLDVTRCYQIDVPRWSRSTHEQLFSSANSETRF